VRRVEKRKRGGEEENQKEVEEQKVEVEEERPIIEPTSRKRRKVDLEVWISYFNFINYNKWLNWFYSIIFLETSI